MDTAARVADILAEAERKVGDLVADAARRRDYAAVHWLSDVAQRVAAAADVGDPPMVDVGDAGGQFARRPGASATPNTIRSLAPAARSRVREASATFATPAITMSTGASSDARPFPRFHREGEQLVKVGYSKSDRRTYEHRCPRDTLARVSALIGDLGRGGRRFTTERMIPPGGRREPTPLDGVPSYQVYLCLAFLVRRGLVRRHGRAGYTVDDAHAADLTAGVDAAWEALPAR